jgi:hypothetical protein
MSEVNLIAKRGDDETFAITITGTDGGPFDLTDCEVQFTAKRRLDPDEDAVIVKTLDDGIEVTNPSGGLATLSISSGDTSGLPPHRIGLYYDIQITDADGLITTPIEGRLTVRPDVTAGPSGS